MPRMTLPGGSNSAALAWVEVHGVVAHQALPKRFSPSASTRGGSLDGRLAVTSTLPTPRELDPFHLAHIDAGHPHRRGALETARVGELNPGELVARTTDRPLSHIVPKMKTRMATITIVPTVTSR